MRSRRARRWRGNDSGDAVAWQASPPALIARFGELVPHDPRIERRKMFGYPAAFVNGHLFASLYRAGLVLKLPAADRALLQSGGHARPFEPMPGRVMGEFVLIPGNTLPHGPVMTAWMTRALEHVASLPPKAPRKKAVRGG
ncbi:TfoX/Sxy family protein [Piscinibacter sp. XHJ-5]|uniref:TfoX/Sxy family protein n=1 Tax=Piscinibacter sp. XHJ-5 TaxID=3037797 RepID=UPI0024535351|nr:TfoX/Sxy family protein [Piscinibacter sp. XHJ-5]